MFKIIKPNVVPNAVDSVSVSIKTNRVIKRHL